MLQPIKKSAPEKKPPQSVAQKVQRRAMKSSPYRFTKKLGRAASGLA